MSNKLYLFVFIVILVIISSGCCGGTFVKTLDTTTPAASPVSSPSTFTIDGYVRDYKGAPISNAKVSLEQNGVLVNIPENPQFSSDGRINGTGEFKFKNVPSGQYTIVAEKDGNSGSIKYSGYGPTDIFLTNSGGSQTSGGAQFTTPVPTQIPATSSDYYSRNYKWSYNGEWSTTLSIPQSLYDFYKKQPHNRQDDYAQYALSDYDRPSMKKLVDMFKEAGTKYGYSETDDVLNIVCFVQALPYTSDKVTTGYDEYPRYPIETLVDNGGDCEDTSILTAALLHEMGYGVVLFELPGHMAVGVKCANDYTGTYVEYEGVKYYYLETTGENWKIGQIPDEFKNQKVTVYPLVQIPKMDLNFTATPDGSDLFSVYYRVHCDVKNIGTGTANNVSVYFAALALSKGSDRVWSPDSTVTLGDISEGSSGWAEASLKIPKNENTQIECVLYGNNFETETRKTNTFTT